MSTVVTMTPDQVKGVVDTLKKYIQMGKALAMLTPTKVDDEVLDGLEKLVVSVEPFIEQPWFSEVVTFIQDHLTGKKTIDPNKVAKAVEAFKEHMA